MVSRLLKKPGSATVEAVTWPLKRAGGATAYAPRPERGGAGGDASQLRAKLDALTSNLEAQTKAEYSKGFQAGQAAARQ